MQILYIISASSIALLFKAVKIARPLDFLQDPKGLSHLIDEDLFCMAPDEKEKIEKEDIDPDKLLEAQANTMCTKCRNVIEKIIKDPDNAPLLKDIRNAVEENDSKKISNNLSKFIQLVKSKVSELQYDQPGFDGNQLRAYIDTSKCHQFRCDQQAKIIVEILKRFQEKEKSLGNYQFQLTGEDLSQDHTAVAVYKKKDKNKAELISIIDSWIVGPAENPKVFLNVKDWKKEVSEFTEKEIKEHEAFCDSFKDKSDEKYKFYKKWAKDNPEKSKGIESQDDYIFFKYYANLDSNLRFAITSDFFDLIRDKILYYASDLKLTGEEKKELCSLSIKGKDADEQKKIWKVLDIYIAKYFTAMYPKNEAIQKKYKK